MKATIAWCSTMVPREPPVLDCEGRVVAVVSAILTQT
jgi:hypothetical protein